MNGSGDIFLPRGRSRLPPVDVDDALQYTPLSSVIPFSADIIPLPSLACTGTTSIFQSEAERRSSRQTLDQLDRDAQHDPNSKIVRKYLSDISSHISAAGGGTEFRFKSLGKRADEWSRGVGGSGHSDILKHAKIGKFGEMVMNKSNVSFRYPTPSTPGPIPQTHVPNYAPSYAPPTPNYQNQHSYKNKNRLPAASPQASRPTSVAAPLNGFHQPSPIQNYHQQPSPIQNYHQQIQNHQLLPKVEEGYAQKEPINNGYIKSPTPPSGSQKADVVKIPPPPSTFDRSQYAKHIDIDKQLRKSKPVGTTNTSKSRKRKRSHSDAEDEERLASGVDQRAKAESLLKGLQGLMNSIFEAEDNLSPDTSDRVVDKNSKMWMTSSLDGDSPCLATAVQMKLENSIQRVISAGRFGEIPVDDLARLQKICESSLKQAESTDVMVKEDDSQQATDEWLGIVGVVDNGLKTAKTVLRIMVGGREEKQIYSEDLLAGVLTVLKNLIESTVNPMIEMRSTGEKPTIFKMALAHRKVLAGLLHEITSVFTLLSKLLALEEVTEGTITTMEFIAVSVIFIENASTEKDSVFGVQKVERFRVAAMDVLAKIFARYPDQRTFIFDEILTSLEKLPVNRQSARQFKLVEGKNIQLVSALIMRLVQTSGTYQGRKRKQGLVTDEDGEVVLEKDVEDMQEEAVEGAEGVDRMGAVDRLHLMSSPLLDSAQKNAAYVVNFLVQRAMKSTKTGDQPYRVLMDIFTEDFIAVLGSPEWPGAEMLLRSILGSMCTIVDGDKQTAPAKSMALDLLGLMGSAICDVVVHLRESHRNRESLGDSADGHIVALTENCLENSIGGTGGGNVPTSIEEELIDWEGPFRYALEHLLQMTSQDGSLQSACGYYLTVWSERICTLFDKVGDGDDDDEEGMREELARIAGNLKRITLDKSWIDDDFDVEKVSQAQVRQAYVLTVLHMPFCMSFEHILNRLLRSVDDNQATTRSKGLKAILQLLQKDPGILKRPQVIPFIIKRLKDPSPLVRDSAVDLIGKCIQLQPELEDQIYKSILERASDAGVGVRKRAMKILKDIYLRSRKEVVKVAIAEALVQRIKDNDTGVSELARKTFEEIWITPFYGHMGEEDTETAQQVQTEISPQMKLIVNERVAVIVKVVQKEVMLTVLHDVIKSLLHPETKNCSMNFRVCKTMVGSMCDDLLDRQGDSDKAERQSTLQTLTVFARANPKLFTPEQLIMLQPYIENLTAQDDLHVFRSVIVIFRCALPVLSNLHTGFLATVQQSLLKNLSRLPSPELKEVIACLWTINGVLKNPERLIRVTISCLTNILRSKGKPIETKAEVNRLVRTLHILGLFGKHCNFEDQPEMFKTSFPQWSGSSVSGLITDTIIPFCDPAMNPSVRKAALESLGHVCQTHARHFVEPQILKAFDQVFQIKDKELMNLVLLGIKGFLHNEELRSNELENVGAEGKGKANKDGDIAENGRLDQLANQNHIDGVSTSLAQKYLKNIIQIALASQDVYALTATEVIGSILRQGLVHPKECVPALVALETSTNATIQAISYREHRTLHTKHETIVERGYMDGVRSCFQYQRNVIGDASGATANPFVSKMRPLYDIVKSSRKIRKKLLQNLTMSVDFEPTKLELPNHLEYSKFVIENLAFFDYGTLDELYHVVTTMERVVARTGIPVAHSIETDIFFIKIDVPENEKSAMTVDPAKLKTLSVAAGILTMLWETRTYLRKLYALNDNKSRDYKANKVNAKDMNKAPNRNSTVSGAGVWQATRETMKNLETDQGRMRQCREFVEILSVDNEFKLAAEGEEVDDLDAVGDRLTPGAESDHEGGSGGMGPIVLGGQVGGIGGILITPSSKGKKRKLPINTLEKGIGRVKKKTKPRLNKPKKE